MAAPAKKTKRISTKPSKGNKPTIQDRIAEEGPLVWNGPTKLMKRKKGAKAHVVFTQELKIKFLDQYANTGTKHKSAASVGVSFMTVEKHLKADAMFADAFEKAKAFYVESLRNEVHRRGVKGVIEPVFGAKVETIIGDNGKPKQVKTYGRVGGKRKFSDTLLMFHTKRYDPSYRDNVTVNSNVRGVLVTGPIPEAVPNAEWESDATADRAAGAIDVDVEKTGRDTARG